jgi:hypothetical protein
VDRLDAEHAGSASRHAQQFYIPLTLRKKYEEVSIFFSWEKVYPLPAADWAIRAIARLQSLTPAGTEDPCPSPASRLALDLRSATVDMGPFSILTVR